MLESDASLGGANDGMYPTSLPNFRLRRVNFGWMVFERRVLVRALPFVLPLTLPPGCYFFAGIPRGCYCNLLRRAALEEVSVISRSRLAETRREGEFER